MNDIAAIGERENDLWQKTITRLRREERWVLAGKLASALIGTVMLGIAGFINAPEPHDFPWKWVLGTCGAILVVVFGAIVALAEHGGVAEIDAARAALQDTKAAMNERDIARKQVDAVRQSAEMVDARRRERLAAITIMLETVEAALIGGQDAGKTATQMLERAIHAVRKAIDYRGSDFLTISIFKKDLVEGEERMIRIAAQWSDPSRAGDGGRSWRRGEGYTGVAWSRATGLPGEEVIEMDTTLPEIATQFPVPSADPAREMLYRSVAAIPILIGKEKDVWGVVTATCDRPDMFRRGGNALERQNVDVVRDIARFAGLLAGLDLHVAGDGKNR